MVRTFSWKKGSSDCSKSFHGIHDFVQIENWKRERWGKRGTIEGLSVRSCISSWHPSKWAWIQWLPSGSLTSRSVRLFLSHSSVLEVWNKQSFPAPFDMKFPTTEWETVSLPLWNGGNPDLIDPFCFSFIYLLRCTVSEDFKIGYLGQENSLSKSWILKFRIFFQVML